MLYIGESGPMGRGVLVAKASTLPWSSLLDVTSNKNYLTWLNGAACTDGTCGHACACSSSAQTCLSGQCVPAIDETETAPDYWAQYKLVLNRCTYIWAASDATTGAAARETCRRLIKDTVVKLYGHVSPASDPHKPDASDHDNWVPVGDAIAMALYAIDAIYPSLCLTGDPSPCSATTFDAMLSEMVTLVADPPDLGLICLDRYYVDAGTNSDGGPPACHPNKHQWNAMNWGLKTAFDLYSCQDSTATGASVKEYYREITRLMSVDGAYGAGPGYAIARVVGDDERSITKSLTADIARLRGFQPDSADYAKYRNFYKWLFTFAISPNRKTATFGDNGEWTYDAPVLLSAKFWMLRNIDLTNVPDSDLDGYVRWYLGQSNGDYGSTYTPPDGGASIPWRNLKGASDSVFALTLSDNGSFGSGVKVAPKSTLFSSSGAAFREDSTADDALGAALWNFNDCPNDPRLSDDCGIALNTGHAHTDVNAIHFAGYGQPLLLNVGYNLPVQRVPMRGEAWRNNTVTLIDGLHEKRSGNGLHYNGTGSPIGFTSGKFDWARAESGDALPGTATHTRHMMLVHTQGGIPGYLVVVDEYAGTDPETTFWIHWYPNAASTVQKTLGYRSTATITSDLELDILFGSPGSSITYGNVDAYSFGDAMHPSTHPRAGLWYVVKKSVNRRALTVLVPKKASGGANVLGGEQLTGPSGSYTGTTLRPVSGTLDVAIELDSSADQFVSESGATVRGAFAVWRQQSSGYIFYFVKNGQKWLKSNTGFETIGGASVDLHFNQKSGTVRTSTANTVVKFRYAAITSATITGGTTTVTTCGSGCVQVTFASAAEYKVSLTP